MYSIGFWGILSGIFKFFLITIYLTSPVRIVMDSQ
ncbi:unnamed protein product [Tuber aestivum]|uniref:Uncharacterized protein n=1 Tax=Tuber aestivum TaxID=59557 RepID=A0A292PYA3_9PEZI|nr:unnamed protein product [Tuber aestivum]